MFVILGAGGKVGAATLQALHRAGADARGVLHRAARTDDGGKIAQADMLDPRALAAAIQGAHTVQVILPLTPALPDLAAAADTFTQSIVHALRDVRPSRILAISDYGAQHAAGAGLPGLFHGFEAALRELPSQLTILRSAEQMQNWRRALPAAREAGELPIMRRPLGRQFATVAAEDVGVAAAALLLEPPPEARVIHVEGPRRYSAHEVADCLGQVVGRTVLARELPRDRWEARLMAGGMSPATARVMAETNDAVNAGLADAEAGFEIRRGETGLAAALCGASR